jgi:hypothetical protein
MTQSIKNVLLIFMALASFCIQQSMAQKKQMWLLAGQSNASGNGDKRTSWKYYSEACFDYIQQGDSLRILKDPTGENCHYFGKANTGCIAPAFAFTLNQLTGDTVIIISAARGGSACSQKAETIYGTWAENGELTVFEACVERCRKAKVCTGLEVDGILWLQGERDANAINDKKMVPADYEEALINLINRFRKELGETLPFYIVLTGYYEHHPKEGYDAVRAIQKKVAETMKDVFLAKIDPATFFEKEWMTDAIHYSQAGYNKIGETLARQVVLRDSIEEKPIHIVP